MEKLDYTYWKESDGMYLGFLNRYPDNWTQGECLEDLKKQLIDLYQLIKEGHLGEVKTVETLEIA